METTAAPATTGLPPVAVRRAVRVVLVVGGLIAVAWLLGVLVGAGNARADDASRPHHTGPLGASVSHVAPHRAVPATSAPAAPTADLGAAVSGVVDRATGTVRHTLAAVPPVVHAATATVARVAPAAAPVLAPVGRATDATTAAVVATTRHAVTHADAVVRGVAAVLPTVPLPTVAPISPASGRPEISPAAGAGAAPSAAVAPTPAMAADPGHAAPRTVRTAPADVSTDRRPIAAAATGAAGGHAPDVTTGDVPTPAVPAPALPTAPTAPAAGGSAPHAPLGVVAAGAVRVSAPASTACPRPVDRTPADRHLTDLADRPD